MSDDPHTYEVHRILLELNLGSRYFLPPQTRGGISGLLHTGCVQSMGAASHAFHVLGDVYTQAVLTLVTASAFFLTTSNNGLDRFLTPTNLGIRLNFDVDVKFLLNFDVDGTNVKTASRPLCC